MARRPAPVPPYRAQLALLVDAAPEDRYPRHSWPEDPRTAAPPAPRRR